MCDIISLRSLCFLHDRHIRSQWECSTMGGSFCPFELTFSDAGIHLPIFFPRRGVYFMTKWKTVPELSAFILTFSLHVSLSWKRGKISLHFLLSSFAHQQEYKQLEFHYGPSSTFPAHVLGLYSPFFILPLKPWHHTSLSCLEWGVNRYPPSTKSREGDVMYGTMFSGTSVPLPGFGTLSALTNQSALCLGGNCADWSFSGHLDWLCNTDIENCV